MQVIIYLILPCNKEELNLVVAKDLKQKFLEVEIVHHLIIINKNLTLIILNLAQQKKDIHLALEELSMKKCI